MTTSSEPSMILVPIFSKRIYSYYQPTNHNESTVVAFKRCYDAAQPGFGCVRNPLGWLADLTSPVTPQECHPGSQLLVPVGEDVLFLPGIWRSRYLVWHSCVFLHPEKLTCWISKIWRFAWKMMFLFTLLNGVFRWTMLSFRGVRLNLKILGQVGL